MDAGEGAPRRFFKVLLPGFAEKLELPVNFVTAVIGEKDWNTVRVRSSLGKLWQIKIHRESNGTYFYGAEWLQFIEAHDLQIGYFLIFDHDGGIDFNVTMYDRSSCLKIYPPNVDDEADIEDLNLTNESSDDSLQQSCTNMQVQPGIYRKACFTSIIGPHNLLKKGYMSVPRGFVAVYNLAGISAFFLVNSKGQWPVKLLHSSKGNRSYVKFGQGWRTFAAENELIEGDSCTFQLLSKKNDTMHFWVTRSQQQLRSFSMCSINSETKARESTLPSKLEEDRMVCCTRNHKGKVVNPNRKSQYFYLPCDRKYSIGTKTEGFDTSYFKITMKHHNLSHKAYVRIPSWFLDLHCISSHSVVLLIDSKGKSWSVHVIHTHSRENGRMHLRLYAGWRDFARGNELKIGDVCIFKLAFRGQRAEMTVEVLRSEALKRSKKDYSIWYAYMSRTDYNPITVETDTASLKVAGESKTAGVTIMEEFDSAVDIACITEESDGKSELKLNDGNNAVDIENSTSSHDRMTPLCSSKEAVGDSNQRENVQKEQECKSRDPIEVPVLKVAGESTITGVTIIEDFDSAMDDIHIDEEKDGKTRSQLIVENNGADVIDIEDTTSNERMAPTFSSRKINVEDGNQRYFFPMEEKRKRKISPWGLSERGPGFAAIIKPYHIISNGYCNIPISYEGLRYLHGKQTLTLVDEKQQVWHAKVYQNTARKYFRLGSGWHRFCRDKGLDVGDECTFELVWTGSDVVMQIGLKKKRTRIES